MDLVVILAFRLIRHKKKNTKAKVCEINNISLEFYSSPSKKCSLPQLKWPKYPCVS